MDRRRLFGLPSEPTMDRSDVPKGFSQAFPDGIYQTRRVILMPTKLRSTRPPKA